MHSAEIPCPYHLHLYSGTASEIGQIVRICELLWLEVQGIPGRHDCTVLRSLKIRGIHGTELGCAASKLYSLRCLKMFDVSSVNELVAQEISAHRPWLQTRVFQLRLNAMQNLTSNYSLASEDSKPPKIINPRPHRRYNSNDRSAATIPLSRQRNKRPRAAGSSQNPDAW
jgi:hypothetical protein